MKKISFLILNFLLLLSFLMISCKEKLPYDEDSPTQDIVVRVDRIGDKVEFSYRTKLDKKDNNYGYKSVYLRFVGPYYGADTSKDSNDYFVYVNMKEDNLNRISPKDLKEGELLIFKAFSVQEIGEYIAGTYLEYMMKPNLEVESVGDVVKYKYYNYKGDEIDYLAFEHTDYECDYSNDNDYYIIDGVNKIKPLDLKVGDKLYFEISSYSYDPVRKIEIPHGGYLYLVNRF